MKKTNNTSIFSLTQLQRNLLLLFLQALCIVGLLGILIFQYKTTHTADINLRITLVCLGGFFILLDLGYLFRSKLTENKSTILALCCIVFFISLPLLSKGINNEWTDLNFHLTRIEALVAELKNGVFPVRLGSIFNDGYGYPASIYYGDLLLYIPALLRIVGFPVVSAYKIYLFFINAVSTLIAYYSFRKIFKNKNTGLAVTAAYMTATYRIVNLYIRAAVGEYSAATFFPLVALAMYQIYTCDSQNWKEYKKNALSLALGMSGIILTHILSTEMTVLFLVILCIVLWKKTFRPNTIRVFLRAVWMTLLLCAFFLIPFIDYYLNVDTVINSTVSSIKEIQVCGAYFGQYFSFWQNIFGADAEDVNLRMNLSPGLLLMIALLIALFLWFEKKASTEMRLYTLLSLFTLFLASNLFPWNFLSRYTILGKLLSQVQFPWRYVNFAILFLSLLFGTLYQELIRQKNAFKKYVLGAIFLICFLTSTIYTSQYNDGTTMCYTQTAKELAPYESDYLYRLMVTDSATGSKQVCNVFGLSLDFSHHNMEEVTLLERRGSYLRLYCKASSDTAGYVQAPVFNYKGYSVTDSNHNSYEIVDGTNATVAFYLPAGFDGEITIDFTGYWYWTLGNCISLIFAIGLLVSIVYKKRSCRTS